MKKVSAVLAVLSMCAVSLCATVFADTVKFAPGTYEGEGKGYSETFPVKVKVTVDENAITKVEIDAPEEVPFGVQQFENYAGQLIGKSEAKIDAATGATMTRDGIQEAVSKCIDQAVKAFIELVEEM